MESVPILGSTFKNASQFPEAKLVRRLRFWLVQFPALSICQKSKRFGSRFHPTSNPHSSCTEHRFRLGRDRSQAGVGCSRSQDFKIQL
jgi:hypothetical protein